MTVLPHRTLVDSITLPSLAGIGYILFFLLPYCTHLGRCVEKRLNDLVRKSSPTISYSLPRVVSRFLVSNWFALLFFGYHATMTFFRPWPYGIRQMTLAPVKTWFFLLAVALRCRARRAPISQYRKAALDFCFTADGEGKSSAGRSPKFVD